MDDEEMFRRIGSQMLAIMGYEVETAADGAEAVERFRAAVESGRPFDAAVFDLTVRGGMGGKEALGKLLDARIVSVCGVEHLELFGLFLGRFHRRLNGSGLLRAIERCVRVENAGAEDDACESDDDERRLEYTGGNGADGSIEPLSPAREDLHSRLLDNLGSLALGLAIGRSR